MAEGAEQWGAGGEVTIVEGERRLNRVHIAMTMPWENWNDVYNEVIDPLAKQGAEVRCEVVIIAKGDAVIRENTLELGIKESLSQRGIAADQRLERHDPNRTCPCAEVKLLEGSSQRDTEFGELPVAKWARGQAGIARAASPAKASSCQNVHLKPGTWIRGVNEPWSVARRLAGLVWATIMGDMGPRACLNEGQITNPGWPDCGLSWDPARCRFDNEEMANRLLDRAARAP